MWETADFVLGQDCIAQAGAGVVGLEVEAAVFALVSLIRLQLGHEVVFLGVVFDAARLSKDGG